MMLAAAILVLISGSRAETPRVPPATQAPPKPIVAQSSAGACSPVIQDVGGNVTVTYQPGSCPGLDPAAMKKLNAFLSEFPRTQKNLNDLLTLRNTQIAEKAKEVEQWINKYRDLEERLRQDDSELSRRALAKLRDPCKDTNIRAITVEVGSDNGPAQAVYRRTGFTMADNRQLFQLNL